MNSLLKTDFYKTGHIFQYPKGTEYVYSTWIARKSRNPKFTYVVNFGLQHFIQKWLIEDFNKNFFNKTKKEAVDSYQEIISQSIGDIPYEHISKLWDLGYLPLHIKGIEEGVKVPIRVPLVTIVNTKPEFFWLTNYIETMFSAEMWGPTTSATIADQYRQLLSDYCEKTGGDPNFIQFQGHDFSMRGMYGVEAATLSAMGHLTSFVGTDTIPAIQELINYYQAKGLVGCSVPATEHSVMCAGGKENEIETFRRLIEDVYPNGIVSIVSDSWDLWKVLTEYLPKLKDKVLARDGKLVIRPDSGDPVDIICGTFWKENPHPNRTTPIPTSKAEQKGVIELLWDTFGGTINEKGYKVLDPHIGAIYGDSITLERAEQICQRLMDKGFCSTNIVFGIGSYTYQYNTRDTLGFALKATWCQIDGVQYDIFKDPATDDGTKKSPKGRVKVFRNENGITFKDQCTAEEETEGLLKTVFLNGDLVNKVTLNQIRENVCFS